MSFKFKIELTPAAEKAIRNLQTLPVRVGNAVVIGMDRANQFAMAKIQQDHLTGKGPFPVEQHKLGVRSGRLRQSVNATPAAIFGTTVASAIGSNVIYAAIHEFGGTIPHKARDIKVRVRTDAAGNLLKQLKNSRLLVFAKASHKRVKELDGHVAAHDVEMPERAPFRTGIGESAGDYKREISKAIIAEWRKSK